MRRLLSLSLLVVLVFAGLSVSSAAPVASPAPVDAPYQVFLPYLSTPQSAVLRFGTGMRADSDLLTGVADQFAYGVDLLYVQAEMRGIADQPFQLDLVFPDGDRIEGLPYAPYTPDFLETRAYCYAFFSCSGNRAPLPAGRYTAELYLNGRLWTTATATIE